VLGVLVVLTHIIEHSIPAWTAELEDGLEAVARVSDPKLCEVENRRRDVVVSGSELLKVESYFSVIWKVVWPARCWIFRGVSSEPPFT
jgi:hypothetical protein